MTKTATDWIAYLEAEPRSEPSLSIAAVLREQAKEIEGLIHDNARLMESLNGEANESERLRKWIDRASALLPLIPRDAGSDLAREVSELLSMHPPRRKSDV